jgi:quercetin dioxygenase-like cupin family protein
MSKAVIEENSSSLLPMLWILEVLMRNVLIVTSIIAATAGAAVAQQHTTHAITPESIQWGPAPAVLPKGAQMAVLAGDPGKKGPFVVRLKTPAGYKIPAHQHPTAETVTVISGDFRFGMGDKLDDSQAEKLGAGGFVDLPANMNHYAFSGGGEAVVQINSEGPFEIKYVNPSDDPSKTN